MESRRDFFGKDAEVEQDDGHFRKDDNDLVEPLFDVEVLCAMLLVFLWLAVRMAGVWIVSLLGSL